MDEILSLLPVVITAIATAVLAIITAYYAYEMRRIRVESVKPIFSLKPDYIIRDEPMALYLINNGGNAKNIFIDTRVNNEKKDLFFVPSIPKHGEVDLDIYLSDIKKQQGSIKIILKFENTYNKKLEETLNLDYKTVIKDGRKMIYSHTTIEEQLHHIANKLTALINVKGGHPPF